MEPAESAAYASETATAQGRLDVLLACMADDAEALATVLNECVEQPCPSSKDLRTVQALEAQIKSECESVYDEECTTTVKELLARARNALADLVAASKQAGKDIVSARKAREKAAQMRQKRGAAAEGDANGGAKKARVGPTAASGKAIFEHGPLVGHPVVVLKPGTPKAEFDYSKPFVVAMGAKPGLECPIPEATAVLQSFRASWSTSTERVRSGRAACPVRDTALEHAVRSQFQNMCGSPSTLAVVDLPPAWNSALSPSMWAVRQGLETAYNEPEFLPCIRLQTHGTRTVVLTEALSLHAAVTPSTAAPSGVAPLSFKHRLWSLLLNMGSATLDAFAKQHMVVHGTLGPCDLLYVPGGWVLAEVTGSNADAFGFKMGLLLADDSGLPARLSTLAAHGGFGNSGTPEAGKNAAVIAALGKATQTSLDSAAPEPDDEAEAGTPPANDQKKDGDQGAQTDASGPAEQLVGTEGADKAARAAETKKPPFWQPTAKKANKPDKSATK